MELQLLQILLVPLVFVFIAYFLGVRYGSKAGWIAFAPLIYSTLLTLLVAVEGGAHEYYPWSPIGIFGFNADGLSIPILFMIALLSALVSIYSIPYMKHIIGENKSEYGLYFAIFILYSIGMMGTILATNLIEFYLFFEVMLIPSYFLIARWGYGDRDRISFMYFMWTHIGALTFLAGILSLAFFDGGVLDLSSINVSSIPVNMRLIIALLITIGLLVKMAVFGVHIWLPYAHAEAPTPISALLSPVMIGIGGYAIIRIVMTILPSILVEISLALLILAVVTMFYGGAMALMQDDFKRLLAYSSISQMGYILLGIASVQPLGVSGSVLQYVSHGLGKGILFMVAGAIIMQAHGLRSISRMGGLARRMPITAMVSLLGFLTIMGIPPTVGFISEFLVFAGSFKEALSTTSLVSIVFSVLAVISTAVTAAYSLWTVKRIFFGSLPTELQNVNEPPLTVLGPILLLAAISVVLGIIPDTVERMLLPVVRGILGG